MKLKDIQKYAIYLLCFLMVTLVVSCFRTKKEYRVVVIQSYEQDYPAYEDSDRLIRKYFKKKGINPQIKTFYLDCEQYLTDAEEKRMSLYLDSISSWKPDLILVYDDQATYSLMNCHHPLGAAVPVVFSGVGLPNKKLLAQYPNVSGFWDKADYVTNIHLIKRLLGECTIYMLHDSTFIDKCITQELYSQGAKANIRIDKNRSMYIPVEMLSLEKTYEYMQRPDSTTVNVVPVQGDKLAAVSWYMSRYAPYVYYLQAKRDFRVMNTSRFSSKPSFTAINEELGYSSKLVGGYITSLDTQIKESVQRAAEILEGDNIKAFPQITESKKDYVFDFREINFWGIDKKLLPKDALFLNRPFKDAHPKLFWSLMLSSSIIIIFIFGGLITMYVKESKAKRQAQRALLHEKESLAEALDKAKESDRMKSVFLANMSHEIRTPLNAIVGFSNLIAELELTQEEKEQYSKIITTNNELLLTLINNILDLARIESGSFTFHMESCNLTELINKLYTQYAPTIPAHIEFKKKCPEPAISLYTDKERLLQAFENTLKNAIKFTSSGFIEIGYEYIAEKHEIRLYVQDTGIGISPEGQKAIFERFKKLDDFVQGTGLGLPICQAIVKQLNGYILLQSEKDKGSRVSLVFEL
ncbi:MAG: HAMP domain-containing sensor histidine kinase [Parabacteroides sp.]|nr:HAMP domain-containing sensor histidine kinase [Parabacteroides sp.]